MPTEKLKSLFEVLADSGQLEEINNLVDRVMESEPGGRIWLDLRVSPSEGEGSQVSVNVRGKVNDGDRPVRMAGTVRATDEGFEEVEEGNDQENS